MARPIKWRKIEHTPVVPYFIPTEEGKVSMAEITLKLEELEAIRLKDLEGLEQAECAQHMEVSRPTFQRILLSAREKIADGLIHGKVIRIEGGNFTKNICPVACEKCGRKWNESVENMCKIQKGQYTCPNCGSQKIECQEQKKEKSCCKHCNK